VALSGTLVPGRRNALTAKKEVRRKRKANKYFNYQQFFMKQILLFIFIGMSVISKAQIPDFSSYPVYKGDDLGLRYSPSVSNFRIWSPAAEKAELIFYKQGTGGESVETISMSRAESGTWTAEVKGDQQGRFYVFRVYVNGKWNQEVPDPYARMVGVNGRRALVADLTATNPAGWEKDRSPDFGSKDPASKKIINHKTDAIIYELHVRDASIDKSSGIKTKGKFLGLTEKGTKNPAGLTTGIDHLKELGVTHIHLLPSYDFYTVDESKLDSPQYNWGYDPLNYNTPEGSYSTNPYDGVTRIREFKELIKTMHTNGLRVVMDVVYNHTMFAETSWFNQLAPGYYYRQKPDGSFSDATACGNETASERPMMRKFILESVKYWVQEFHVDGFRFDLMGVHDIETMNLISRELHAIKPDIILYGEGWTAGSSPLPDTLRALKKNAHLLDRIAVFSDDIRDGIKGSVFVHNEKGFASGKTKLEETIKFGVTAAVKHPQIDYSKINYSKAPYAAEPYQVVSYCECHDNHVLWDKLAISAPDATKAQRTDMHKLALTIVLTSQGISFLHAGTEFLRTKYGVENSFNSGDSINAINWNLKTENKAVFDYVQSLIKMRRAHPAFRMTSANDISRNIFFQEKLPPQVVAYTINGSAVKDSWKKIYVAYNGSGKTISLKAPAGKWNVFVKDSNAPGKSTVITDNISLSASSALILYQN
jgi:pullulanase